MLITNKLPYTSMLNRPAATINMFISISFSDKLLIHLCAIKRITICASLWLLIHYLFTINYFINCSHFMECRKEIIYCLQASYLFSLYLIPAFSKNSAQLYWNRVREYVGLGTRSLQ